MKVYTIADTGHAVCCYTHIPSTAIETLYLCL